LGHFKNRDHLRGLGRSIVLLTISVLLTGANSDISALLTPVYNAEAAQYSQDRESNADAIALHALNCHYGHVGGAAEFFEIIAAPEYDLDWSLTHYFSSHPEAQKRINDLDTLARSQGYAVQ
jgi:Zn-dependent protease with chaperone function